MAKTMVVCLTAFEMGNMELSSELGTRAAPGRRLPQESCYSTSYWRLYEAVHCTIPPACTGQVSAEAKPLLNGCDAWGVR